MSDPLEHLTAGLPHAPDRTVTVFVPGADDRPAAGWPVLILHDGQNLFEPDRAHVPGQHWRVAESAAALIAAGRIPPIVIAGVDHLGPLRIREFTPTGRRNRHGGGAAEYGRFIFETLVPRLARDYGTRTDFAGVAMGGSSLGGLATVAIARQFPGRAGKLLIMSPSVWWDDRVVLERLRRVALRPPPRVWLDIGAHEGTRAVTDARALRDVLRTQTSALRYVEDPHGHHSETAWAARFGDAVEWLYSGVKLALVLTVMLLATGCGKQEPGVVGAQRLATPFSLEAFRATDLEGVDRSVATWQGRVVIVNVWATWCPPCRREIPALAALQAKYPRTVLVLGLLQDNVTDDMARTFGRATGMTYPIVRSSFEIESKLPAILALPMTFVVDRTGQLVAMFAGEIDAAAVEAEIVRLLPPADR
jgi:predicted alpha/beta superfamily hydrolase